MHTIRDLPSEMILASRLDVDFYERVEADRTYTGKAFLVVLIVSTLAGAGMMIAYGDPVSKFLTSILVTLFSWVAWSGITLWIGTTLTKGPETRSDLGEMLRVLGYAYSPQILIVLVFVPTLGPIIAASASLWSLVAGVVAIRQALDFTTGRALLTVLVGWIVVLLLKFLLAFAF